MAARFRDFSDSLYRRSPFVPFLLLGVAVVLFVIVILLVTSGPPDEPQGKGFFAEPLPAVLLIAAALSVIASGVLALVDLLVHRLSTGTGKWAFRLAIVNCLLQPLSVAVYLILLLFGLELEEGWGQPIVPFWLAIGLVAAVLGAVAPETRRRGLLVIPLMIGAFALIFVVGEITVPH
jgi:hypothetical protein